MVTWGSALLGTLKSQTREEERVSDLFGGRKEQVEEGLREYAYELP